MTGDGELLLFRPVDDPDRRTVATALLDDGFGGSRWRGDGAPDLWAIDDAARLDGEPPVAVAATARSADGRAVRLLATVVAASARGRGIGRRMVEELADVFRARGAEEMVAAVPRGDAAAMAVVRRAGFRASEDEPDRGRGDGKDERDVVWFDLEL